MKNISAVVNNQWVRWGIIIFGLCLFAAGNWFFRTFMTNIDERDHLAAGFLMSKGWVLYKDIFSHHFPLPYYWVKLWDFLWVDQIPYRGIAMFRTTLNIYYLACAIPVLFLLKKFSARLIFIFFLLSLVILMPLFHGNILLSESFASFPLLMLIWLALSGQTNQLNDSLSLAFVSALLAALSFWSQPLLAPVYILPFLFISQHRRQYILFSALTIATPLLFFILNNSLKGFLEMGIWFNAKIYPRYYVDFEGAKTDMLEPVYKFFKNQWFFLARPETSNPIYLAQTIGSWLITLSGVMLIVKKKWKLFVTLLISLLLVRIREAKIIPGELFNFGVFAYMMLINLVFVSLIFRLKKSLRLAVLILFGIYLLQLFKSAEPIIRQTVVSGYNYHVFWSQRQEIGQEINRLTPQDQSILIYPHDVDLYYFAKKVPPDRFLYWYPWINEVTEYRQERQTTLGKHPAVMYIGEARDFRFKDKPNLYLDMWPDLTAGYLQATTEGKFSHIYTYVGR